MPRGRIIRLVEGPRLRTSKLRPGPNTLVEAEDQLLVADVEKGKIVRFSAFDGQGQKLKVSALSETIPGSQSTSAAKVKCYICISEPAGNRHCYEVSCDDLPKPKDFLP